jgi:hypothetical protein
MKMFFVVNSYAATGHVYGPKKTIVADLLIKRKPIITIHS